MPESSVIDSFYLAPADGGPAPPFRPGQHVRVTVPVPGEAQPVRRSYSLSAAPSRDFLRISVKREAAPAILSPHLHGSLEVGSVVDLHQPSGRFVLDEASRRPVVLLSAGVGLTPMVAMLERLVASGSRRKVWFVHGARDGAEHAMREHVRALAAAAENVRVLVSYSRPRPIDTAEGVFDAPGRVSLELLKRLLPWDDYDYYLCGPGPFMSELVDGLRAHGIPDDRVRWEAFGADGPRARQPTGPVALPAPGPAATAAPLNGSVASVEFARSGCRIAWDGSHATILDAAIAAGVAVRFACRAGECLTCSTRILKGDVTYPQEPPEPPEPGTALLCAATPQGRVVLDA